MILKILKVYYHLKEMLVWLKKIHCFIPIVCTKSLDPQLQHKMGQGFWTLYMYLKSYIKILAIPGDETT